MPAYTSVLQKPLETIFWEDDNFMEELLQVVRLFRPFSAAITEFISEHGYQGDTSDIDAKVAFIRAAFAKADMDAPREVREWFTLQQPIKRDTVFQICFAFGLDGGETDEFFRRIFTRERSFNCHQMPEAIYYFCLNNGLTWTDAMDIQSSVSLAGKEKTNGDIVYTGSIIAELNNLQDKDDLIHWLNDNIDKFVGSNVTAYETIRRLWEEVSGPDGLLIQERKSLPSIHDDAATGEKSKLRSNASGVRSYDAYLPDRQGIELILRGEIVSYERVRKWLVLLTFYTYWVRKALSKGNYEAGSGDADRCITSMNQHLINSGYPELYVGNPYDWIFFYAAKCEEPLYVFRYIWNELLTGVLEKHQ